MSLTATSNMCRGHLYDKMGNFEAAIADFTAILETSPENVNALFSRGFAYDNQQLQNDKAVADYVRALDLEQKHKQAR